MTQIPGLMKPYIPDAALDWMEEFWEKEYAEKISCPSCGKILSLTESLLEWEFDTPISRGSFLAGRAPAYECEPCGKVYLPPEIFDAVTTCFAKEGLEHFSDFQIEFEKPEEWERLLE